MKHVTVKVPATSANLGPGFDCLGMALALYNEFEFWPASEGLEITLAGEGEGVIPTDERNLTIAAAQVLCQKLQRPLPPLRLHQTNHIPATSGLGSSSTAIIAGLLGVNALLGSPLSNTDLLQLAIEIEGHPDNVAPALFGGLVLAPLMQNATEQPIEHIPIPPLQVVIVLPDFHLPTSVARAALPPTVSRTDAIFNLSRIPLVIRALEKGDFEKLGVAMDDRLHQPYRLPLVPGMHAAFAAGKRSGATAVALSGAGPSLIAFAPQNHGAIGQAMMAAFAAAGLNSRMWLLTTDAHGSRLTVSNQP